MDFGSFLQFITTFIVANHAPELTWLAYARSALKLYEPLKVFPAWLQVAWIFTIILSFSLWYDRKLARAAQAQRMNPERVADVRFFLIRINYIVAACICCCITGSSAILLSIIFIMISNYMYFPIILLLLAILSIYSVAVQ